MTPDDFDFLRSPVGQQWLATVGREPLTEQSHLQWASRLRNRITPAQSHAVLETVLLRARAKRKFRLADKMYFDRAGLEMSSAEIITTYRAQKYAEFDHIADLGCGIGGDAIGLSQFGTVTAVDREPVRLAMTVENVAAYGYADRIKTVSADLTQLEPFSAEALFFDPARRTAKGKRIFSLHRYQPPISLLDRWHKQTANWGIKISPGVDLSELPDSASVEFISVNNELREAVLWYGGLRDEAAMRATILPSGATLDSNAPCEEPPLAEPQRYIYEPDAAVIRAQLVQHAATQIGASMLDRSIAYLTGGVSAETPFTTQFEVEAWFPFQLKRLRSYLRERNVGRLTIKKRGSPLDPDQLRKQLKPSGPNARTVILTRHADKPIVIVCL